MVFQCSQIYFENKNKNFVNRFQKNDSTTRCYMQQTEDTYFLWYRIDVAKKLVTE